MWYNIAILGGETFIKIGFPKMKGAIKMPIDYSGLQDILKARGTTLYKLSAEKVIGGKTREVLFGRTDGNISSKTVEALCKRLNCQPGDFMVYIPDPDSGAE